MAPDHNFAGTVALCLARRRFVDLYTVVRSGEPLHIAVGAKIVCPEGEPPLGFGMPGSVAAELCARLPKDDLKRGTGLWEFAIEPGFSIQVYGERVAPPIQCIVAGAGHVGRELARLGAVLGWQVTVADDRSDFAAAQWFPPGTRVRCAPLAELFEDVPVDAATAVALVTRGHRHDEELLRRIAGGPAFYVGMIGSRRRVLRVKEELRRSGVGQDWLDRLYAPIGLPIGADTPSEIAVAVAAEITAAWKGRGDWACAEKERYYAAR